MRRTEVGLRKIGLVAAVGVLSVGCDAAPTGPGPTPEPPDPPGLLTSATTCLSWEVVEAGETYSQEWLFFGPPPEVDNVTPTFDAQPGLYRIRWVKAYDYFSLTDVIEYGDLIEERYRISNTFELAF